MITRKVLSVLIILTLTIIASLQAQNPSEEMQGLLEKIKTYEYGQSRENLTALNDLLRLIGNSDDLQDEAEEQMIQFLESNASLPAKRFICECLSIYGSDEAVSILEDMLFESKTENMALFALERISAEDASEVLLDALPRTTGHLKVGVINALGNRREKKVLDEIIPLIWYSDNEIASAAIAATGKIGGDQAAEALSKALSDSNEKLQTEIIYGYLLCAAGYEDNHENTKALTIYISLNKPEFEDQVRYTALRGIIHTSDQEATEIIVNFLDKESPESYSIAIPLVQEIPESEDVTPIINKLSDMQPAEQVKLFAALAGRKDPTVVGAMIKATKSSNDQVRIAALNSLSLSGGSETALLFAENASGSKGLEKMTARRGLDRLNAPGTDELILKSIPQSEDSIKIELIQSTSSRYITTASSILIDELQNQNLKIRIASIKALREIASPEYLDALISHHMKTKNDQEIRDLENAIVAVSKKIPDNQSRAGKLLANLDGLDNIKIKSSYFEMMGRIGDPKALPVLKAALKNENVELKSSAIRGLSKWSHSEPSIDLLDIAKSSSNQTHRALAFRGYLNLIEIDKRIDLDDKTKMYKEAMTLAKGISEKRLVFSGIADIPTLDAFNFVTPYLDDQEVRSEAEIAVINIAEKLDEEYGEKILPIIKKVKNQTQNEDVLEESLEIIRYLEEKSKK